MALGLSSSVGRLHRHCFTHPYLLLPSTAIVLHIPTFCFFSSRLLVVALSASRSSLHSSSFSFFNLPAKSLAAARALVRYFGWESMGRMQQFNHPMKFVDGKPGSFDKTGLFR